METMSLKFNSKDFFNTKDTKEKLKFLINYAILAPSSHNTQPWFFKIKGNFIEVKANMNRALPISDPTHRELFISLGTSIENLKEALEAYNFKFSLEIFYDCKDELVARFAIEQLKEDKEINEEVLNSIISRRNNRFLYQEKNIPKEFLEWAESLKDDSISICLTHDKLVREKIVDVVLNSIETAFSDKKFRQELSYWVKPSLNKYKDGIPGNNIGIPFLFSFLAPYMIKFFNIFKLQRKSEKNILNSAPILGLISVKEDNIYNWIKSGMLYEEIALKAERNNIKTAVLAAPVEIKEFYKDLQQILNTSFRPQIFFRLGYSNKIQPQSPRLNLEEVIID